MEGGGGGGAWCEGGHEVMRNRDVQLPAAADVGGEQQAAAAVRDDDGDLDSVEGVLL